MIKPFDLFLEKKFPNEENPDSLEEAQNKWNTLDSSKKLKFIKKAEKKYDAYLQENPDAHPFSSILSFNELEILLKSYGLPDKTQQNSKMYFFKKKQDEARKNIHDTSQLESVLRETRVQAEAEWKKLSEKEKHDLLNEFHQKMSVYEDDFFDFARKLPQNRIIDYKEFCKRPELIIRDKIPKTNKKEPVERFDKKFSPFEIFFEKYRTDFDQEDNLKARNDARAKFKDLSDKKKLKYIKKAESNYDDYFKNFTGERQLLSSFLNKNELKLLMESYGMPDSVPNFSAYYFRKKSQEGFRDMKQVFDSLKQMTTEEKEEIHKEHSAKQEEFLLKKKLFLDSLPFSRLEDFNSLKLNRKKQSKLSRKSVSQAGSPNKKLKRNSTTVPNSNHIVSSDEIED